MAVSCAIRMLIAVTGLLIGLCVYSYGMFHTLMPTRAALLDVSNCGAVISLPRADYDDDHLCQVAPGSWRKTPYKDTPAYFALAIALVSIGIALYGSDFLRRTVSTLSGHVLLGVLFLGLPLSALFLHLNFVEGTLTREFAEQVVGYGAIGGTLWGIIFWFTATRGVIRKRKAK